VRRAGADVLLVARVFPALEKTFIHILIPFLVPQESKNPASSFSVSYLMKSRQCPNGHGAMKHFPIRIMRHTVQLWSSIPWLYSLACKMTLVD
jgi:hypothetical protein